MTKLDVNNMNLIENSLKKVFRSLDEINSKTSVNDLNFGPLQFTKLCVSLIWFMKVYLLFKEEDKEKVNKISLKTLKNSILYFMIEGDDCYEKMKKFNYEVAGKSKSEINK